MTNTLDPGYAAATQRRTSRAGRSGRRRAIEAAVVAVGCALTGFTLAIAYVTTHQSAPQSAKVHSDLVNRARTAQVAADDLDRTAQTLNSQIDGLRNAALAGSGNLRSQLQTEQLLAGTTAVTGPGVIVNLANPAVSTASAGAGRPGTTPIGATAVLTDHDVRSVVNELWADGAEAISVNDVRLTPTSAIRFAGEAVLVDFEPINAPYVIRAIGNADRLDTGFAASSVASRYQTLAGVQGIGFNFDERSQLQLPASALADPRYAHAIAPSPSGSVSVSVPTTATTGASK